MRQLLHNYHRIDQKLTQWMKLRGILFLRISIGVIFLWFGVLKFFPGLSPAEDLAVSTIRIMTFGLAGDQVILYSLAALETLIGAGLIGNMFMRATLLLLFIQMAGTFFPVISCRTDIRTPAIFTGIKRRLSEYTRNKSTQRYPAMRRSRP